MIRKAAIFISCLLLNFTFTSSVKAEETVIVVSGNGADSSSQVQVQSQNTTEVTQNNDANISNNVNSDANTGNNDAGFNTGETAIVTGDSSSTTTVNNQNINTNAASISNCNCDASLSTTVSGNGSGSTNTVAGDNFTKSFINQSNTANITNNITINGNTGYNNASFNGGNVTIKTGNVTANTLVNNKNINNSVYLGSGQYHSSATIKIDGNGAYSDNNVDVKNLSQVIITNSNIANILNNILHNLNTGGNEALKNIGDVAIITGDITSNVTINNENINSNFTKVDCDCKNPSEEKPTPTPVAPPSNGGTSIVQGSNGSSSGSSSNGGPANGNVLPVTGNQIPLTLVVTLILFFMFLSGLYLRFHSANAPPTK